MQHRHINIFLSSTFRDMHSERDYIKKYVIPQLRNELQPYGITIDITDLRWGIDTTEDDEDLRESKVLHVCMDAIRKNRPYFIGLLGNRYGWVPSEQRTQRLIDTMGTSEREYFKMLEDRSVTEMEMLFGALADSELLKHSYFFLRDEKVYDQIPEPFRNDYIETEEARIEKLKSLKHKVISYLEKHSADYNVFTYETKWDETKECLVSFQDFGAQLKKVLLDDILNGHDRVSDVTPEEYEDKILDSVVYQRTSSFCGREEILNRLKKHFSSFTTGDNINGFFLTGFSGCGKTSIFCKLYEDLKAGGEYIVLAHAAGQTTASRSPEMMLKRWNSQLRKSLCISNKSSEDEQEEFNILIIKAFHKGIKPIILIDSYDSFEWGYYSSEREDALRNLSFIPKYIPFVCTTLPGFSESAVTSNSSYSTIELEHFTRDEATQLIHKTLSQSLKELPGSALDVILSKQTPEGEFAFTSPLWLRIALSILDELGNKDFVEINKEAISRDDMKISSYIQRLADNFNPTPEGIFSQYLELSGSYFNKRIVMDAMLGAVISSSGISTYEISKLCGNEWDELEFESFAHWARPFFVQNEFTGRWNLNHDILKKVLSGRDENVISQMRGKYISILKDNLNSPDTCNELLCQLINHKDVATLMEVQDQISKIFNYPVYNAVYRLHGSMITTKAVEDFIATVAREHSDNEELLYITYCLAENCSPSSGTVEECLLLYKALLENLPESFVYSSDRSKFITLTDIYKSLVYHARDISAYEEWNKIMNEFLVIYNRNKEINRSLFENYFAATNLAYIFTCWADIYPLLRWRMPNSTHQELAEKSTEQIVWIINEIAWLNSIKKLDDDIIDGLEPAKNFYTEEQIKRIEAAMQGISPSFKINTEQPKREDDSGWIAHCLNEYEKRKEEEKRIFEEKLQSKNAKESARRLEEYINENIKNRSDDNLDEYVKLYMRHAELLISEGNKDLGLESMRICAGFVVNHAMHFQEMYDKEHRNDIITNNINSRMLSPVVEIVNWFAKNGEVDLAVRTMENLWHKGLVKFAFTPSGDGARKVMTMLINVYRNLGKMQRAEDFMEGCYEFFFLNPMPPEDVHINPANDAQLYCNLILANGQTQKCQEIVDRINDWPNFRYYDGELFGDYIAVRCFEDDWSIVAKIGTHKDSYKWGYADEDGNEVIAPTFDEATYFSDDRAMVGMGNPDKTTHYAVYGMKYGYIDRSGAVVIPIEYEYASAFYNGEALVCKAGEFYYIDINGNKTRKYNPLNL